MRLIVTIGAILLLGACQMTPSPAATERASPPATSPPNMQGAQPPNSGPPSSGSPNSGPPSSGPPSSHQPPAANSCGAERLQYLIGQPLPQTIPADGPVRIFATDDPVTMDYSAQRLNIEVDRSRQRRIVAITCG